LFFIFVLKCKDKKDFHIFINSFKVGGLYEIKKSASARIGKKTNNLAKQCGLNLKKKTYFASFFHGEAR
jgi:hypothetical protein